MELVADRVARPVALDRVVHGVPGILGLAGLSGLLYAVVRSTLELLLRSRLEFAGSAVGAWDDPANHGQLVITLASYALAVLGLLAVYDRVIAWCAAGLKSHHARWLVILLPVAFHGAYLLSAPAFSTDVYSYAAYGYIGSLPSGNPYYQEGRTVIDTDFGQQLVALGWTGSALSPYGPVWNGLELAVVRLTQNAAQAVLLGKAIVVAATFGSALLVYVILRSVRPSLRLAGAAAVLWNPVLVVLVAGDGHNDGFVLLLVLASLALTVRRHTTSGVLMQLLAVFTKYLPVVLLPVQIAYWWRTALDRPPLALGLGLGALLGVALAVWLYQPVWLGANTFMGTGALGTGTGERGFDVLSGLGLAARYLAVAIAVLFGAWRARDAASLLQSCAVVMLVAVLLGPQRLLPWYAVAPLGLMALSVHTFRWPMLVLSACALLASPIDALPLYDHGLIRPAFQTWVFRAERVAPVLSLIGVWAASTPRAQQLLTGWARRPQPA